MGKKPHRPGLDAVGVWEKNAGGPTLHQQNLCGRMIQCWGVGLGKEGGEPLTASAIGIANNLV